jgi:hypothetical protein
VRATAFEAWVIGLTTALEAAPWRSLSARPGLSVLLKEPEICFLGIARTCSETTPVDSGQDHHGWDDNSPDGGLRPSVVEVVVRHDSGKDEEETGGSGRQPGEKPAHRARLRREFVRLSALDSEGASSMSRTARPRSTALETSSSARTFTRRWPYARLLPAWDYAFATVTLIDRL